MLVEPRRPRLMRVFERVERWLHALVLMLLAALIAGQVALSLPNLRRWICPIERLEGKPVPAPDWTYEGRNSEGRLSP